jgi:hypothetical protein
MKKFVAILLAMSLFSNVALAECDFSTGISRNDNGTYTYSKECHIKVGEMKYDLGVKDLQIEKLNKALDLKDLAITKADQRADMWMNTTYKLEDRINTIDQMRSNNQWIAFGLGALTMFAAAYAASQLSHNH